MPFFQRLRDFGYAGYFLVHLAAAILFDAQVLFSKQLFPHQLTHLMDQYVKEYKDPLIGNVPHWFKSFLYLEIGLQVPFLIVGIFGALAGARWMRIPSIVYSTSVVTSVSMMISHIMLDDFKGSKVGPKTSDERMVLGGIYGSFLLVALIMLLDNVFLRGGPSAPAQSGQGRVQSQKKKN